ncbi:hypothetical protein DICVIV_12219 [Dictyocaulus viviparus]|uniref:AT hook motif protein n=1 Tax=Dictyocaulus viviparus TaxID=29172 RepID=A0A0D8XB44_DICVI|nr:hypothetical protein DICVIV_12219 [Dictyocaulus viviparus]
MDSGEGTAENDRCSHMTPDDDALPVKKRGRPPKVATVARSKESTPNLTDTSAPVKRKRGRKSLAELAKEAAKSEGQLGDNNLPVSPSSEKRNRLSTWAYAEYSDFMLLLNYSASDDDFKEKSVKRQRKVVGAPASGRKRGRPPKNASKSVESNNRTETGSTRKRGRPPKKRIETSANDEEGGEMIRNGTSRSSISTDNDSESFPIQKINSYINTETSTEKRRRGRPRKSEKLNPSGKWTDVTVPQTGNYTVPLPVPESWPMVMNMEEVMKELYEMYANVKDERRAEFHNQIKAFVFALHWEDGTFSAT